MPSCSPEGGTPVLETSGLPQDIVSSPLRGAWRALMPMCQSSGSPFCPHVTHSQGPSSSVLATSPIKPRGIPESLAPIPPVPKLSGTLTPQGLPGLQWERRSSCREFGEGVGRGAAGWGRGRQLRNPREFQRLPRPRNLARTPPSPPPDLHTPLSKMGSGCQTQCCPPWPRSPRGATAGNSPARLPYHRLSVFHRGPKKVPSGQ